MEKLLAMSVSPFILCCRPCRCFLRIICLSSSANSVFGRFAFFASILLTALLVYMFNLLYERFGVKYYLMSIDPTQYPAIIVWNERFSEFITAGRLEAK